MILMTTKVVKFVGLAWCPSRYERTLQPALVPGQQQAVSQRSEEYLSVARDNRPASTHSTPWIRYRQVPKLVCAHNALSARCIKSLTRRHVLVSIGNSALSLYVLPTIPFLAVLGAVEPASQLSGASRKYSVPKGTRLWSVRMRPRRSLKLPVLTVCSRNGMGNYKW
jgi:hypothetical protein